jgi:hypothetical protein
MISEDPPEKVVATFRNNFDIRVQKISTRTRPEDQPEARQAESSRPHTKWLLGARRVVSVWVSSIIPTALNGELLELELHGCDRRLLHSCVVCARSS